MMTPLRMLSTDLNVPRDACFFLDEVRRKQHRIWLSILIWWICCITFISIAIELFGDVPNILTISIYVSVIFLYIPFISLRRLKCPYCEGVAGVLPFLRYKFVNCKSCNIRIECAEEKNV